MRSLMVLAAVLVLGNWALAQEPLVNNLDFGAGAKGWGGWAEGPAHKWEIEPTGGHQGKPALRIEARDPNGQVMVMTSTDRLQAGERYVFEAWWRKLDVGGDLQADLRVITRDKDGKWLSGDDLRARRTVTEGEWTGLSYRLMIPAKTASASIGIWVRQGTGTIWVSDISVRPAPLGVRTYDSMYTYDPEQVPLGMAPLLGFQKLRETNSPFLARSQRWNRLLMDVAFWQEDMSRAKRVVLYRGRKPAELAAAAAALKQALADLDALQQSYGRLYVAKNEADLATVFDPAAERLGQAVENGHGKLRQLLAALNPKPPSGAWLNIPKAPTNLPWWDPQKRQPRYMLWNRWSDAEMRDREEPLELGDCQTLTAGTPADFVNGVADWSSYSRQRETLDAVGAKRFTLITHYSLHDKGYLAPEFAKAQGDEPDLRMWDEEGKPLGPPSGLANINWLNPKVREHMVDVLTQMAKHFRSQAAYQFCISSWESSGPYIGNTRIGGNPTHKTAFQGYLRARYGTVEKLNQAWGSSYGSFGEVAPVPEAPVAVGEAGTPLLLESQRWAQEAYVDYIRAITDTWRRTDPTKPMIGQQSGLMQSIVSPNIVNSVDILGYHNRSRTVMPLQLWLTSVQRYTNRPLALYENFWGCQEDHPQRLDEEPVMRAQLRRYLYRHAAWGRCTQTWWYAYTSAPYLLSYNGNWFTPTYDLTTFRYSAAGLPVEKRKVDRFEAMLLGSAVVPSRLLVVQPYAAMLAQGRGSAAWQEWIAWHNLLFPRNQLYEALPDTWFAEGKCKLSDFDAVILPVATHLDPRFTAQLLAFLQRGGLVVASGPPALFDDLGRPDGSLLRAATPAVKAARVGEAQGAWEFDYGVPANAAGQVEVKVGKGRLVLLPRELTRLADKGQSLAGVLRQKVTPAAEAPGTTLELLLRRLPDGRHLLCVLNRDPDQATAGEVRVQGVFSRVADVDQPRPAAIPATVKAGATRFRLALDPGETAYVLLAR